MNRERLFLIAMNVKEIIYFPCSVNENTPVIREITNLFLEIREHGL